ncbi:MAG: quinoprotein relay system zinc metallohydrolase 2 [Gimesia sp.]
MTTPSRFCQWLIAITVVFAVMGTSPLAAFEMKQVTPGLFVHFGVHEDIARKNQGDIANIGFIVGEKAVAVIDTGGSFVVGSKLRAAIRRQTDLPIRYVILTHVHPDHIFGAAAFVQDNPVFIGHENLVNALAARGEFYLKRLEGELLGGELSAGTIVPKISKTVKIDQDFEINLGNRRLTLRAHPSAHTDNDLTIFDHSTGTLWLADLLFRDRIPRVDGSITGWIKVLDDLTRQDVRLAIPGHGPVSDRWPQTLTKHRKYLSAVVAGVRRILKAGGSLQKATKDVGWDMQSNWELFAEFHPGNVTAAFVELEWE